PRRSSSCSPRPPAAPSSTLFPYTTLFRSETERSDRARDLADRRVIDDDFGALRWHLVAVEHQAAKHPIHVPAVANPHHDFLAGVDRKSTRLNSSHGSISYAVFCLKKKTRN